MKVLFEGFITNSIPMKFYPVLSISAFLLSVNACSQDISVTNEVWLKDSNSWSEKEHNTGPVYSLLINAASFAILSEAIHPVVHAC